MPDNTIHSTTQTFLDIFDITNNLVILKDGTCSLIIQVDAMNFGLLAEEEQDSIMYAYAGLLNSLNYPIQIVIHSQTKDVTSYLQILKDQEDTASNRNQQQRIRRYREFVSNLIRERNVLDKKFYVTITATPLEVGVFAPQNVLPGKAMTTINPEQRSSIIEKARNILEPKRDHLLAQFARLGLFARQLPTQEIIQFFYISYNPEAAEGQHIADTSNYTTPLVTAGVERVTMNDAQTPASNQPVPVVEAVAAEVAVQAAEALTTQVPEMPISQAVAPAIPAIPAVQADSLPSPMPDIAQVPPQLTQTGTVMPETAAVVPPQSSFEPAPQAQSSGYVPTQMPTTPVSVPVEMSKPASIPTVIPEMVTPPVELPTETPTMPAAMPVPHNSGPTLASIQGGGELPKPTLPQMQGAGTDTTPTPATPEPISPIEPIVPPAGDASTSQNGTEVPVQPPVAEGMPQASNSSTNTTSLPPLPEI